MISAILLSGGSGKRAQTSIPKQYLPLAGKEIILHSLQALLRYKTFTEIVIVCEEKYEPLFTKSTNRKLLFARPGKERKDSVKAGLDALSKETKFVCIHDGARPFLQQKELSLVVQAGIEVGAAALATPVSSTIKQVNASLLVDKTLSRNILWEMQTPQVISYELLQQGYAKHSSNLTDDVSFVEAIDHPVQIVPGREDNIKITTPKDLQLAALLTKELLDAEV